jgi:hypothetical protein
VQQLPNVVEMQHGQPWQHYEQLEQHEQQHVVLALDGVLLPSLYLLDVVDGRLEDCNAAEKGENIFHFVDCTAAVVVVAVA